MAGRIGDILALPVADVVPTRTGNGQGQKVKLPIDACLMSSVCQNVDRNLATD